MHHSFSGGTDVDRVLSVASFEWNRPNPAIGWRPGSLIRVWAKTAVRRPWNWPVDLTGWRVRAAGSLPVPLALAHLGLHQDWDLVSVRRQCNAVEAVVAPSNAPLVGKLGPVSAGRLPGGPQALLASVVSGGIELSSLLVQPVANSRSRAGPSHPARLGSSADETHVDPVRRRHRSHRTSGSGTHSLPVRFVAVRIKGSRLAGRRAGDLSRKTFPFRWQEGKRRYTQAEGSRTLSSEKAQVSDSG